MQFLQTLYKCFADLYFTYLEINPIGTTVYTSIADNVLHELLHRGFVYVCTYECTYICMMCVVQLFKGTQFTYWTLLPDWTPLQSTFARHSGETSPSLLPSAGKPCPRSALQSFVHTLGNHTFTVYGEYIVCMVYHGVCHCC